MREILSGKKVALLSLQSLRFCIWNFVFSITRNVNENLKIKIKGFFFSLYDPCKYPWD